MAKKKSKTQKQKKNIKRKNNKAYKEQPLKNSQAKTPTSNTNSVNKKQTAKQTISKRKIVKKDDVEYKVFTTTKKKNVQKKPSTNNKIQPNKKAPKEAPKKAIVNRNEVLYEIFNPQKTPKKQPIAKKSIVKKAPTIPKKKTTQNKSEPSKEKDIIPTKEPNDQKTQPQPRPIKTKNAFLRLLIEIYRNSYILFNAIIIITFIILIIGLKCVNVFNTSTIVYIGSILLFLIIVAITQNKYLSGKVFTIILTGLMAFGIYHLQYTYDFIRGLNTKQYEYKEYFVVAFDNSSNKSIYNINNKKVGLIEDNSLNIERVLNTKLDSVRYTELKNQEELFTSFYQNEFRAIIVTENQYKYLKNNKNNPNQDVKKLYNFKVVTRKQ